MFSVFFAKLSDLNGDCERLEAPSAALSGDWCFFLERENPRENPRKKSRPEKLANSVDGVFSWMGF